MLNLKNVRIDNCGTGISAPKDAKINADGLEITNTKQAIELRDPPSLMIKLGLPENTPPMYLIDAMKILEGNKKLPDKKRIDSLKNSPLVEWLGTAADLATIGCVLLSAQTQGLISSTLERIFA
ncbi:hypothetical protein [Desulfotalea psychrophila]|uniref:Uncharacterized protein n=1 Tax=Desulfotalea psychrophila (strain LSv54 / DSM 12343) TaxID=177439 RepID=Q6AMI0_DESPS|nr:hypothetical protein [Desulfotalea psychrophila]CAG36445.1 unknown protein [Desulfotalea psychrophila LSv54]